MMLARRYRQMMGRCAWLFVAGTALQLCIGKVDAALLAYPWGVVAAVNYLYLLILLCTHADRWKWVRQWCDRPAYIVSLASMLVLTLIFGLVRQDGSTDGWTGALGWTDMASSWVFNLFLFHFLTVMGLKAVDDVWHWKARKGANVVMHAAFFVIVAAAFFGSGDLQRVRVVTALGYPENRGTLEDGHRVDLPFALVLKEFSLEEYPPRVYLASSASMADFVVMEGEGSNGQLGDWQVECREYLEMAGKTSEEAGYVPLEHVGATTALYLQATHRMSGETVEGWVSCGSHIFDGCVLTLPDGGELVMPRREVKKFLSAVEVHEQEEVRSYDIAVNHPASFGPWKIYQYSYDASRGKWSTTSVLECVKDGWYVAVQTGMWLILAGGVMMCVRGWSNRKRRKEGDA